MTPITNTEKLPLDSSTVNGSNINFGSDGAESIADGSNVNIVPIIPGTGVTFNSFSASIAYKPAPHLPQPGSIESNVILANDTAIAILNNYSSIDVDINGELQTLVLNTDANVKTTSNTTLVTNGSVVPNSISGAGCIQIGQYIYLVGGANSVNGYTGQTNGGRGTIYSTIINSDGSLNGWVDNANPLPQAVSNMLLVRVGNYLYSIGGSSPSGIISNVYSCPINADNTLGAWTNTGINVPISGGQVAGFTYNNYIYYLSSWPDGSPGANTAYYSTVSSTGILGGWVALPYNLPAYAYSNSLVQLGLNIYVIGGGNDIQNSTNTIYSMSINPDGTLTSPQTISNPLPYSICNQGFTIVNNVLYLIAGYDGNVGANTTTILQSTITNNELGPWSVASISLPVPLGNMGVINTGTNLYVIGGSNSSTSVSSVYQAPITSAGIGSWLDTSINQVTSLPQAASQATFLVIGNYLYMFGGFDGGGLSSIYYSAIGTNGTLGAWQTSSVSLPFSGWALPMVIIGTNVYLLGGFNGSSVVDTVYSATIGSNGLLSDFVNTNQNLPIGLSSTQAYANANYVYLLGGYNGGGPISTIYYAPIQNGSIGTWGAYTLTLPGTIYNTSIAVIGSSLFIAGGGSAGGYNTIYECAIDSTGLISSIVDTTSILPSTCAAPQLLAYNEFLYYIGGNNSAGNNYNIYQATYVDNILSEWNTIPTYVAAGNSGVGAVMLSQTIYILGGTANGTYYSTIWSYEFNTTYVYNLIPANSFASIPNAIYLTANTYGVGLLGDTSNGDSLVNLSVDNLSYNSGLYTYQYNSLDTTKNGNNAYLGINNLNNGDVVVSFNGTITGNILNSGSAT